MRKRLRSFVAAHLAVDEAQLTDGTLLGEELAVDSLAAIELAMAVEDEFAVTLREDVMGRVHTYGDLERAVAAQC